MSAAKTAREKVVSSETLPESFLSQIQEIVSWACRRYQRFPDQSVIDDLTQEIAFSLIKNNGHNLNSFEHRSKEKTWLRVVVWHYIARHFKSQKPTVSLEDLPEDSLPVRPPSQEAAVLFKEVEKLVGKAQDKLTERERELWNYVRDGLDDK
jgi:RNA polymerase sigma factor (sigma-70 family)